MKICFWVSSIATIGGVQRVTSIIANELSKDFDITIFTHDTHLQLENRNYPINEDININSVPKELNILENPSFFRRCLKKINKSLGIFNNNMFSGFLSEICLPKKRLNKIADFFNNFDFDIIIGVEGDKALILSAISDKLRSKTIGWQHNSFQAYFRNKNKYYWNLDILFKKNLQKLGKYILLNEYDSNELNLEFGVNSTYIYNPKSFNSLKKCDMKKKRFISVGRFCYAKGFDILIKAIKIFHEKNDEWKFYIVGEGEMKSKIIEMIKKYKLEDYVILPGFTNNIKKYYLDSSVCILSSRWEGMPMVILEALEMGCPVISNNITAIKPLVSNNIEGLIVDIDETGKKLSEKMLEVATSIDKRNKLSKNAIRKSKQFEMNVIIEKWKSVIKDLK